MSLVHELRRHVAAAATPVLCACAIFYFGYHLVEGDRGLYAYGRLVQEIAVAKQALGDATAERRRLERRVSLLRPNGLDTDMLDEQARNVLGVIGRNEVVIIDQQ